MKTTIWYSEYYLPTKRHRKERVRVLSNEVDIEFRHPSAEEFPVAMVTTDYETWFDDGKSEFEIRETEYRLYDGELYKPVRASDYVCRADGWATEDHIRYRIENRKPWGGNDADFVKESIITRNTFESELRFAKERADSFIVFGGKIWRVTGEPMYLINTFGLGFNHGGTSIFIEDFYNSNISHMAYFNANQKAEAIKYGVETALSRGDDKSVEYIRDTKLNIKVLIPEAVRRNPVKDHGDGDEFLNGLESLVQSAGSASEAGILVVAKTMAEISG